MAQKVQVLFEDDLDGSEADGTVSFALDNSNYEIDLTSAHADELRNLFAPYIAVGRKISLGGKPTRARKTATRGSVNTADVREWAKSQGIKVNDRGRIPAEILEKYQNRNQAPAPDLTPVPPTEFKSAADVNKDAPKTRSRKKTAE